MYRQRRRLYTSGPGRAGACANKPTPIRAAPAMRTNSVFMVSLLTATEATFFHWRRAPRAPQRGCRVGDPARSPRPFADASPRIRSPRLGMGAGAVSGSEPDLETELRLTRARAIEPR